MKENGDGERKHNEIRFYDDVPHARCILLSHLLSCQSHKMFLRLGSMLVAIFAPALSPKCERHQSSDDFFVCARGKNKFSQIIIYENTFGAKKHPALLFYFWSAEKNTNKLADKTNHYGLLLFKLIKRVHYHIVFVWETQKNALLISFDSIL